MLAEALTDKGYVTVDVDGSDDAERYCTGLCPVEVVGEVEGLPAYRCITRDVITLAALVAFRSGGDTTRAVVSITHSPAFIDEI